MQTEQKLQIGKYTLSAPVILAPMSGITDKPFRNIVRKFGAPLLVTEMIASRAMIIQTRQSMDKSQFDHDGDLTSVQLAGAEGTEMREASKLIEGMGAKIIDINFGCPAKKIVNSYSGSHLMKDEKKASEIIKATVDAVSVPVTLKMRMGWDNDSLNAPKLAKIAEDLGVQMITIHGRTRCQFYSGKADWKFIKSVKEAVKIPVVANGDIKTYDDIDVAMRDSEADGLMIGRGAYGKPWIIQQFTDYILSGQKTPDPKNKQDVILEHYQDMLSMYGLKTGMQMARKHIGWYSAGLQDSALFRAKFNQITDHTIATKEINNFFSEANKAT